MSEKPWYGSRWPKGVAHEISGYERPLHSLLEESATKYPDKTYTIFQGAGRTFSRVNDTANRLANFLATRGIKKGERVAIFLPNIPHYPEIFFGILKAGAVCVTCNPLYKAEELNFQLRDSGARAVFVMDHPQFYPTAVEAVKDTHVHTVVICNVKSYLPALKGLLGGLLGKIPKAERHEQGHLLFDQAVKGHAPEPPEIEVDPVRDPAVLIYTGGTTGLPKGAVLTHSNMLSNVLELDEWIRLEHAPGEPLKRMIRGGFHSYLGVLPWYHSFGLTVCMLSSCYTGSRLVCIPDPRAGNPPFTDVLKSVERYKITTFVGVPTIFSAIVNHPLIDQMDLSSIIGCGSGAAPLPVEVIRQFEAKTGAVIFEGYGMTEASPVITMNPTNKEQRKIGSVGPPLPSTDIKILDVETGTKELSKGEDGEIAVCGPQVMRGYWDRPDTNKEVFREIDGNRYLLTGDIGHLDEDGFLVITDRKKDLILVGGFNVYPREIEEVLYTHPKVALVAVIGVPDPHKGEAVKAFIQLKEGVEATEEEFIEFCREKMAGYKRPKYIEFRKSLPTSVVGKVLRRVLRDEELKKLEG